VLHNNLAGTARETHQPHSLAGCHPMTCAAPLLLLAALLAACAPRALRSGFVGSPYDLVITGGRVVGKVAQGVTTEILDEATTPAPTNDA
jgi:hypothetical protein